MSRYTVLRQCYHCLFISLLPLILMRLLWRSFRSPTSAKNRLKHALGGIHFPPGMQGGIWVHAASMGESTAVIPLVQRLQQAAPHLPIVFTTNTPTGAAKVKSTLKKTVFHCYIPLDVGWFIRTFLNRLKPRLLILVETELWPNVLYHAKKSQIPVFLANGRLSKKSAQSYAAIPALSRTMMRQIDHFAVQSQTDADRFLRLGADPKRLTTVGNLKYDLALPKGITPQGQHFRAQYLGTHRLVWIAASTHHGEEAMILEAFKAVKPLIPELLLVLVPRHTIRTDTIIALCQQAGLLTVQRSDRRPCTPETDIFLGDSMGEMLLFYAASDLAFIGGSLVPDIGGHNPIEAAALKLPLFMGPYVFNCKHIIEQFWSNGSALLVRNAKDIAATVTQLRSFETRKRMGTQAFYTTQQNKGSVDRHLALLASYPLIAGG